jgi:2-methylcitrate dehydratase
VEPASFSEERLRDARLASLVARTSVLEDASLTAQYPESSPTRIVLRLKDGSELRNEVRYPRGHHLNPMSDAEVQDKFRRLFSSYGRGRQSQDLITLVDGMERLEDIGTLFAGFARRENPRRRARSATASVA